MKKYIFTDCIMLVGSSCSEFNGERNYISTGAVDVDTINDDAVEVIDYKSKPSRANLVVESGDILFAKMQATKKSLHIDAELAKNIYSTGFCAVRANNQVLIDRCLYHLIGSKSFLSKKDANCSGATQKAINNQALSKIVIKVPDIIIQDDIADQLDKTARIIKLYTKQLSKYDNLIKARFVEMFGDPISNPMGWDRVQIDDCVETIENGKSFVCDSSMRKGEEPAILKLSAVTYGVYKPDENKTILDKSDFVKNAEVHSGDLLFTRKNTPELVGMAAYVYDTPKNLMMPDLIFRINPKKCCRKIYLWRLINHDLFRSQIQSIASGSAKSMSNISKERLGKSPICLPPLELQIQFEEFVKQVDKSKVVLENIIKKYHKIDLITCIQAGL